MTTSAARSYFVQPTTSRSVLVPASIQPTKQNRRVLGPVKIRATVAWRNVAGTGTVIVYVGGQDVDSTIGYALTEDEVYDFELGDTDDLWVVASAATGGAVPYCSVILTGQFDPEDYPT